MSKAAILLAALLIAATALLALPAQAPASPVGTVTVRVAIVEAEAEGAGDWIIDGQMDALGGACFANARTGHSRYVAPQSLEFHLRFDGSAQAADCVGATYTIRLVAQDHVDDSPLDLDGTPGPGTCAPLPAPPRAAADHCVGTITFALAGGPRNGTLDGNADLHLEDQDMRLVYDVRVVASDLAEVPGPGWKAWLVRLHLDDLQLRFLEDPYGGDWLLDGEATGSTANCRAEARTMHSRFATPTRLDFLIRDGESCGGQVLQLRFLAYMHADDGPVDLNGAGPITHCPVTPDQGPQPQCELRLDLTLAEGELPAATADGADDHRAGENDGRLTYRVAAWYQPARATAHVVFDLVPEAQVDDWLLDGNATGGAGCGAEARTSHSRYQDQRRLDLDFRGPGALACMQGPLTLVFTAYAHASDSLMDIGVQHPACPSHPTPTREEAQGCTLTVTWSDPATPRPTQTSDGDDDGHPLDLDARITYSLRRYT